MKVLIVTSSCSYRTYNDILNKRKKKMLDSSQYFFNMVIKGFVRNNIEVDVFSIKPISHSTYRGFFIRKAHDVENGAHYFYPGFLNIPVLNKFCTSYFFKRFLRKNQYKYDYFICDPLLIETKHCFKGTIDNNRLVSILTDMPSFASAQDRMSKLKRWIYKKYEIVCNNNLRKFKKHVFLSKNMNDLVHAENYIVIECLTDIMEDNKSQERCDERTVMYAGKIHEEFGADMLMNVISLVKTNCTFDIYGDGNYIDTLTKFAEKDNRIRYHGIVPISEVQEKEKKATLLINPRTSKGEFTKYSFPSKTAEYLSAGRPIVCFKLAGIPDEYDDILCYPRQETPESMANKIDELLNSNQNDLDVIGAKGKSFIISKKNYILQCSKIIDFMQRK